MSTKIQAIAASVCLLATTTDIRAQVYCYAPSLPGPPVMSMAYRPSEPGRPFCSPQCSPELMAEYERALTAYHRQISDYTYRLERHARDLEAYHANSAKAYAEYERCLQLQSDSARR